MIDRQGYDDFNAREKRQEVRSHMPELRALRQAAVSAELLVGDPHRGVYQQMIQANMEAEEEHIESFRAAEMSSNSMSAEDLAGERINLRTADTRRRALLDVLALPSEIRGTGMNAGKLLRGGRK